MNLFRETNLNYHFEKLYEGIHYRFNPDSLDQSPIVARGNVIKSNIALRRIRSTLNDFKKAADDKGLWVQYESLKDAYNLSDQLLKKMEDHLDAEKNNVVDLSNIENDYDALRDQFEKLPKI